MINCQLFGLWPGGHHLTSVCLHATAAVSLFLALGEMTGRLWPSAFVAAVFALHPLRRIGGLGRGAEGRVERPVLHAHALGVRAVRCAILRTPSARYLAVVAFFVLGLLSKPMLVTLPFVLLLLDWWPLGRLGSCTAKRLLGEKVPLLALAVASCVVTVVAQRGRSRRRPSFP